MTHLLEHIKKIFKFKKRKEQRQYIEGLEMLEDGINVQLRQAIYRLQRDDLTPNERVTLETLEKHCEYVLEQISDIWDGKLHY